jgi:hypothetical protein
MQAVSFRPPSRESSTVLTGLVALVSESHIYCALLRTLRSARSALRFQTLARGVNESFLRRHREGIPESAVRSALLAMLAAGLVRVRDGRILLTRVGRVVSRLECMRSRAGATVHAAS